ncbi:hypothetical protein evm_012982 [Chilo suppressalis]|nr:hypothetical protein evm_012982 [Chilo suppressalis]
MALRRKLLNLLFQLFCAQNTLAQTAPYGNGCPCQRPFGNQNQIINLQPPRPPLNYVQSTPINYPINQRTSNELAFLSKLPLMGSNLGINYPINQRPINELAFLSNLPVISNSQGINRQSYNLPAVNLPPNFNNIPILNQINNLPFNSLPIGLLNTLPLNNQITGGNVPPLNQFNYLPNNNIPIKNVPIVNQLRNLPVNLPNLPIVNGLPFANLPNINTLPIPNPQPINRVLYDTLPVSNNLPAFKPAYNTIPNINNLPINIAQLLNANPTVNTMPLANNLPVVNNLPIVNNQQAVFIPNRYQILNNPPINPLANGIITNQANPNVFAANKIPFGQPNNVLPNLPVANNARYLRETPNPRTFIQNSPAASNDCGCQKSGLAMLLEKELANSFSEPVVSLNGLQLGGVGGLGNLPLFNGLPVIGMTESVVNLDSCNCQN